jgi:hypothetical protein
MNDRKKTNNIFEFSTKNAIWFTYFSLCDKKYKLFCYPVLLAHTVVVSQDWL